LTRPSQFACLLLIVVVLGPAAVTHAGPADGGVIRLTPRDTGDSPTPEREAAAGEFGQARRGFDYAGFESRLESLWLQRKTLLGDGRKSDAENQDQLIRSFCIEEGVGRLENLASALIAESGQFLEQGDHEQALRSLQLADALDPGRGQVYLARASVLWDAGDRLPAASEVLNAGRASLFGELRDLSLFGRVAIVLVVALAGCVLIFAMLMLLRHQVSFRHEVEEHAVRYVDERVARAIGWVALFLPVVLWVGAGWIALYWIVISFRFMRRSERLNAVLLLLACVLAVPAYRVAVSLHAIAADPVVRTTLAASGGEYGPDRVLELQQLVQSHPEDPTYRFLLAGLYKNGRYFEEAYSEYLAALELDPGMEQAYINVGNIFYATGQFSDAISNYRQALEYAPGSILAYFNLHVAQSEAFRFKEAEESLQRARELDPKRLAAMLSAAGAGGDRQRVLDASIELTSVWDAALVGRRPHESAAPPETRLAGLTAQFANPISIVSAIALLACAALVLVTRQEHAARRCIRCGRPFCRFCKSSREAHEYCSQCLHLFVLGDGLAAETKTRKLFEVERHERLSRKTKRWVSLLLPGAAQQLRGQPIWGTLLMLLWLAALLSWQPAILAPLEELFRLDLQLGLLDPARVPASFDVNLLAIAAMLGMPLIWLMGNLWCWRGREI
jgi:tetratricopeptide (TPR) repeat protein